MNRNRKPVLETLQESESHYRFIVENLQEGLWIVDPNLNFIFVNQAFCDISGFSREEVIGRNVRDFVVESEFKKILHESSRRRKGISSRYELNLNRKDGFKRSTFISAAPWINENGEFQGAIGLLIDRTELERIEKALSESEERFKTIINASKDGMITIDQKGLITLFNPAAAEIFGYKSEEMMGKPLDRLMPEEYRTKHRQDVIDYFAHGKPRNALGKTIELPALRCDGSIFPIELSLSAGKLGDYKFVLAVIRDISRRKSAEEALRETKERYRSLVDNIGMGITLIDRDFNIKMVNPEQVNMSGKPAEKLLNMKCYEAFEGRESVCPFCPGRRALNSGFPDEIETRRYYDDGSSFEVRIHAFPIFSKDNQVTGFIEVVEDITDRKRMEDEIQEHFEARLQAERRENESAQLAAQAAQLASIGVIAAGITHEINQPLSAIQMHANTLQYLVNEKKYVLPDPFNRIFTEISEGTKRISGIVEHMRSFWLHPNSEPFAEIDFYEAVASAFTLVNRKALSHSIRLNVDLCPDKLLIEANKLQIEQIVINLVINAIHSLDQKPSPKKEITIATSHSDSKFILKVEDNGIGLPTRRYEDLFNPFFSTKKPGEGMGLGLAIVKMFVDRFRGEIEALNNEEGGATFIVRFPLVIVQKGEK